jgi:PTS system nitrogen regulatory IIA component
MSPETLMDIKEVANYLRVKDSTVYTWAQEGKLPAFRLGRLWRFRRADLDAWLENTRYTQDDEENESAAMPPSV